MDLIGREDAIARLCREMADNRLVTVWGPPGVGKTALVACALPEARICSLVGADSVDAVCWSMARCLGLAPETDVRATVRRGIEALEVPLVLDGVDDALEALSELVPLWIGDEGPPLVTTSRRAFAPGAQVEVRPLTPSDAMALLARLGCRDAELAPAIVERLDRVPLAIEWFAARAALLGVGVAWERVRRFAEREDPLEAALAESLEGLGEDARELLLLASMFDSGAPTPLLARLDVDLAALDNLVATSLVRVEDGPCIRPYRAVIKCMRKLADDEGRLEELSRKHADLVLGAAEERATPRAIELELVASRFRAWDPVLEQRALLALCPLALRDGTARAMVARLEDNASRVAPTPEAHLWLGRLWRRLGRFERARATLERAEEASLRAAIEIAHLDRQLSRTDDALAGYARVLERARAGGDPREEAIGLGEMGRMLQSVGRFGAAQRHHERAIALAHQHGMRDREALERSLHARALHRAGRVREAIPLHEDVLRHHERDGRRHLAAAEKGHLGFCHHEIGELATAERWFRDSVAGLAEVGDVVLESIERTLLARLLVDMDRQAEARLELAIADPAIRTLSMPRLALTLCFVAGLVELAGGDEEAARAAWAEALELGVALEVGFEALLPAYAGFVEAKLGELATARRYFAAAEDAVVEVENLGPRLAVDVLRAAALGEAAPEVDDDVAAVSSDVRRALRLASGASTLRVARDGRQVVLADRTVVELGRRAAPRRLLLALVDARMRAAGCVQSFDTLIAAGWPGERIVADAARKRLRTAIWTLRKMGLDEVILTEEDGYLLDPLVPVEWSR